MKMNGFDEILKKELISESKEITAPDHIKNRINAELSQQKRGVKMKKINFMNMKKYAIIAACVCLLVPTGIMAGGKINGYVTSNSGADYKTSKSWSDLSAFEKKTGISTDVVKQFSNGYAFSEMERNSYEGVDTSGNTVAKAKNLTITYTNNEKASLDLIMEKSGVIPEDQKGDVERTPDSTATYSGIAVNYFKDTYKFEPSDYKETAQDKELEKQGNYYVSYGTDKEEISIVSTVSWEKDGVSYSFSAFDTDLSPEQLMDMAGELIK